MPPIFEMVAQNAYEIDADFYMWGVNIRRNSVASRIINVKDIDYFLALLIFPERLIAG